MIMSRSDAITDNDLDFFLTVISMFCEYNHTMHYSDRVFADITDNPGRTKRIILKLAEEGYIKAVPRTNLPYRFTIDMTPKGTEFQKEGGYACKKRKDRNKDIRTSIKRFIRDLTAALLGALANHLFGLIE